MRLPKLTPKTQQQIMRRSKTQKISKVIQAFLKESGLESRLKEVELINSWEEIVGTMISRRTKKVEIKNGKMIIYLQSSVVKNELMMLRESLRNSLNEKAGEEIIKEIVLK